MPAVMVSMRNGRLPLSVRTEKAYLLQLTLLGGVPNFLAVTSVPFYTNISTAVDVFLVPVPFLSSQIRVTCNSLSKPLHIYII